MAFKTWVMALGVVGGLQMVGAHAQAIVPLKGAFVPSDCGVPISPESGGVGPMSAVCVGRIAGDPDSGAGVENGAQFRLHDGSLIDFRVTSSSNVFMAFEKGASKIVLRLESTDGSRHATLRVLLSPDGSALSASGVFEGAAFAVPELQQIFVIQ